MIVTDITILAGVDHFLSRFSGDERGHQRTDDPWACSQLFTLRLWYELVDAGQREVRMQAKHILTGETRYFREWAPLAAYLVNTLDEPGTGERSA